MDQKKFSSLIQNLYSITYELEQMFPGRYFTPDGHMVGSIGECLAAYYYDLQLLPHSSEGRDAKKSDHYVEIKATQGDRVALRNKPEHLIVLKLFKDGSFSEVYNGPGKPVWESVCSRPKPSNGQYQISLSRLKKLMSEVPEEEKLPMYLK